MISFQGAYEECQEQTGDTSTASLALFKSWLNRAVGILRNDLGREYSIEHITGNIVASRQYYQIPEYAIRVVAVSILQSTQRYELTPIYSENTWKRINASTSDTATIPDYFHPRGKDEVGLYPIPSTNITSGLEMAVETRVQDMSQADYTTGSVTVTAGSATVTGSGTTFTASMVGRYFKVTDGSEGIWYRIGAFVSTTEITLENMYEGSSGGSKTYKIGEMPQIPEELQESTIDYAMFRFYMRRKDANLAAEYKSLWDGARDMAKELYANPIGSTVIKSKIRSKGIYGDSYDDNMTLS